MIFLDIETDGLNPTVIHCAVLKCNGVHKVCLTSEDFSNAIQFFSSGGSDSVLYLCGHNIVEFDWPVLARLWSPRCKPILVDSLILSRLAKPDRDDGHSLDSWGQRLGFAKGDHHDWSRLSDDMIEYCQRDVDLTEKLYRHLMDNELNEFDQQSIDLEHRVAMIIAEQKRNGFLLDVAGAERFWTDLAQKMKTIETTLRERFPPIVEERYSDKTGKRLKDKVTVFNIGSRKQIGERLASIGVKFTEKTANGQAKVDETILRKIDVPEAQLIADYLTCQKRAAQVESWINAADDTNRVHGSVNTIGAVTGRMTHSSPNMAQVPATRAQYGHECRSLWIVPEQHSLVGIDADGLEMRMLAHYMKNDEFIKAVSEGNKEDKTDAHSVNARIAGVDRDTAKTLIYALIYGAGDAKLGSIVGGNSRQGKIVRDKLVKGLKGFERLIGTVQKLAERGWLPGLDGRRIEVRSEHAALNTLLQGAGAVVMKVWLMQFYDKLTTSNIPFKFVANVHDEVQIEVPSNFANVVGRTGVRCFNDTASFLNLRCPLTGDYNVGSSWAETH